MDISKLPKLSETPKPPESVEPPTETPKALPYAPQLPASVGGEAWISLAFGILLILWQQNLLRWITGRDAPQAVLADGTLISYTQSFFFLNDLGLAAFGFALILNGLTLLVGRPLVILFGLLAMVGSCVLNGYTLVRLYPAMGLQWFPAIALIMSVYTAIYQWKLIRMMKSGQSAPMT